MYHPKEASRSPFQVFNFYLVSGARFVENGELLDSLMTVDNSVCGDLNFIEKKSDSTSANPTLPPRLFCLNGRLLRNVLTSWISNMTPTLTFTLLKTQLRLTLGPRGWIVF
jgi:hypothetical protein